MIEFVQTVLAFVLVLAPLVFVHELGHFLAAKMFGIGVPVFSLGFGPRLAGFRRRETDYRLSAIPLGGYVRLHGDESDEQRSGAADEFLSRPKHQRFIVFIAGPLFNVVTAFLAFWFLFAVFGKSEVPVGYHVVEGPIDAETAGPLQSGDKLIAINGIDVENPDALLDALRMEILLKPDSTQTLLIERDGERMEADVEIGSDPKDGSGVFGWRLSNAGPTVFVQVVQGEPAEEAGFEAGDEVIAAGGQDPVSYVDFRLLLASSPGRAIDVVVKRGEETLPLTVTPRDVDGKGHIGAMLSNAVPVQVELGLAAAAGESLRTNVKLAKTLFEVLKRLFNWGLNRVTGIDVGPKLSLRTLSGPVGIAQYARSALEAGFEPFLFLLGFFSLQLGILNLMPIPVLDGGHILILFVEGLMRRELSEAIKEKVMLVGFVMLIALMSTVIVFDFLKL